MMLRVLSQRLSEVQILNPASGLQLLGKFGNITRNSIGLGNMWVACPFFLQLGARNILIAELGKQWWRPGAAARAP